MSRGEAGPGERKKHTLSWFTLDPEGEVALGLLLRSLPAAGTWLCLQAGEVEEVVWESQELLSAFLCGLRLDHQVPGRQAWQRWTGLPLSGGSWEQSRQLDRVQSGLISCCFLILDFLEETYGCFMSFLYNFF